MCCLSSSTCCLSSSTILKPEIEAEYNRSRAFSRRRAITRVASMSEKLDSESMTSSSDDELGEIVDMYLEAAVSLPPPTPDLQMDTSPVVGFQPISPPSQPPAPSPVLRKPKRRSMVTVAPARSKLARIPLVSAHGYRRRLKRMTTPRRANIPRRGTHVSSNHSRSFAVLCIRSDGFTLTNGYLYHAYDGPLRPLDLLKQLFKMKVGYLVLTDAITHTQWREVVDRLPEFHPSREIEAVLLKKPSSLGLCLFCSQEECHRWIAVLGGISQFLQLPMSPIPHNRVVSSLVDTL
ncbi:uncharacterized protein [Parasteatoda tepidariorum]|uniref:uncharacterized protein n=1 Tax=Parasteatoda tepidariorum TaxID=114398 RepID=UPI0039BD4A16